MLCVLFFSSSLLRWVGTGFMSRLKDALSYWAASRVATRKYAVRRTHTHILAHCLVVVLEA